MNTAGIILLLIDEEHGFRDWYAVVTRERYAELVEKFKVIQPTLTCLVPVRAIVPEARGGNPSYDDYPNRTQLTVRYAHFHEAGDSYMEEL